MTTAEEEQVAKRLDDDEDWCDSDNPERDEEAETVPEKEARRGSRCPTCGLRHRPIADAGEGGGPW